MKPMFHTPRADDFMLNMQSTEKTTMDRTNHATSRRLSVTQGMGRRDYHEMNVAKVFAGIRNKEEATSINLNRNKTTKIFAV